MRRTAGGRRGSRRALEVRVTPSMRRKVDELAVWLAAGDPDKIRTAREAVVELLKSASLW